MPSSSSQLALYLGPEGTFSYFAGRFCLGSEVVLEPCHDLEAVFEGIAAGRARTGIVPLENSMQGTVVQSLDCFLTYPVQIQGEIFCKITHSLLAQTPHQSAIQRVYSHPQALLQCGRWLKQHLAQAEIIPVESTAAAAKRIQGHADQAAIGHTALARTYNLQVLQNDIGDLAENYTRFLIIGTAARPKTFRDKSSILFTVPDTPGSLAAVLNILARESLNLKKLESRPLKSSPWAYFFFADVDGDLSHPVYTPLCRELAQACRQFRILGCYVQGQVLDLAQAFEPSMRSEV